MSRPARLPESSSATRARLALRLVQTAAVSGILALSLGFILVSEQPTEPGPGLREAFSGLDEQVRTALEDYDCSPSGYAADVIPSSALIKTAEGEIRHVSFDRGWAVHTSDTSAASLVAVCLSERPGR